MIGETNINGGAGLNGEGALLKINAETGSIITVSKEGYSKVIKTSQLDPDDNNRSYWFFQTKDFGEWTVTATKGTNTKSVSVEITSEGQSVSVTLFYRMYLYNKGDECTTITGGWVKRRGTITKNTDNLYVRGNGSECGIGQTTNKIDLSKYSKLYAIVTTTGGNNFSLGLTTTTSHSTGLPENVTASVAPSSGVTKKQYIVDVSAITDANNYAYIYSHAYQTNVGIYLYELWLE